MPNMNLSPQHRLHALLGGRAQAGRETELACPRKVEVRLEREEARFQPGELGGEAGGVGAEAILCTGAVQSKLIVYKESVLECPSTSRLALVCREGGNRVDMFCLDPGWRS